MLHVWNIISLCFKTAPQRCTPKNVERSQRRPFFPRCQNLKKPEKTWIKCNFLGTIPREKTQWSPKLSFFGGKMAKFAGYLLAYQNHVQKKPWESNHLQVLHIKNILPFWAGVKSSPKIWNHHQYARKMKVFFVTGHKNCALSQSAKTLRHSWHGTCINKKTQSFEHQNQPSLAGIRESF